MDFALSSSTVLCAAVIVWLLWVAPYFLRRRAAEQPAGEAALLMESVEPLRRDAAPATSSTDRRAASSPSPTGKPAAPPRRRIRWGRLVLALTGLCALLAAVVTLVLMVVGVHPWVPLACLATAVGCVAVLRSLAVRDRKRRLERAFGAAMNAPAPRPAAPAGAAAPNEVFDAGREPAPVPRTVSREELRSMALEVAKASQASAEETARASGEQPAEWEPVDVPRPSYLDAAKAERPDPEPLQAPAEPRPEGRPLTPAAEASEPASAPGVPALGPAKAAARGGALGNLDEVLQRRRA